jgi:hypothetical protein
MTAAANHRSKAERISASWRALFTRAAFDDVAKRVRRNDVFRERSAKILLEKIVESIAHFRIVAPDMPPSAFRW